MTNIFTFPFHGLTYSPFLSKNFFLLQGDAFGFHTVFQFLFIYHHTQIKRSHLLFSLAPHLLLLLLLSHFSRVWFCATPEMAAHQAPPSLGFSRQEHWSGLPFPSPMHESKKWKWSCSVMSDSSRLHGLQPTRFLHPWDFPGKSTGVGCHCLLHAPRLAPPKSFAINLTTALVSGATETSWKPFLRTLSPWLLVFCCLLSCNSISLHLYLLPLSFSGFKIPSSLYRSLIILPDPLPLTYLHPPILLI